MITLPRRRFLTLAAGLIAAPVIVRASAIMPVKAMKAISLEPFSLTTPAEARRLAEAHFRAIHHTNNPAVVFLDILNDQDKSIGGRIDWSMLGDAADYCEEAIPA